MCLFIFPSPEKKLNLILLLFLLPIHRTKTATCTLCKDRLQVMLLFSFFSNSSVFPLFPFPPATFISTLTTADDEQTEAHRDRHTVKHRQSKNRYVFVSTLRYNFPLPLLLLLLYIISPPPPPSPLLLSLFCILYFLWNVSLMVDSGDSFPYGVLFLKQIRPISSISIIIHS